MNALISNPADCEVRGVTRFLQAENVRPSVRKWCIMFTNGRTDVHDAEKSVRPSVITDALKEKVISEVYEKCSEVSRALVYKIVTKHLQNRKICARWVARRPSGTRRE